MHGVIHTVVGYTGGWTNYPTYQSVCGGDGHTEAIKIEYDETKIAYTELLDVFFANHNPSQEIVQYKSVIWYHTEEQETQALEAIAARSVSKTEVRMARDWWDAEESHQKFEAKQKHMCRKLDQRKQASVVSHQGAAREGQADNFGNNPLTKPAMRRRPSTSPKSKAAPRVPKAEDANPSKPDQKEDTNVIIKDINIQEDIDGKMKMMEEMPELFNVINDRIIAAATGDWYNLPFPLSESLPVVPRSAMPWRVNSEGSPTNGRAIQIVSL